MPRKKLEYNCLNCQQFLYKYVRRKLKPTCELGIKLDFDYANEICNLNNYWRLKEVKDD